MRLTYLLCSHHLSEKTCFYYTTNIPILEVRHAQAISQMQMIAIILYQHVV